MSGVQQRLNLKRTPIDTWSLREQLTLASSVLKSGDQNWVTVSRMMKQFAEPGRPHDWINQKTCAAQYNLLEERFDIKRPKRGEKIEAGESPMELIVKKLSQERIDELEKIVSEEKEEIEKLEEQTSLLSSDEVTEEQLQDILKQIQGEEAIDDQKEAEHNDWLAKREAKILEIKKILTTTTTAPKSKLDRLYLSDQSGSELDSAADSPLVTENIDQESSMDTTENSLSFTPSLSTSTTAPLGVSSSPSSSPLLTALLHSPSKSTSFPTSPVSHYPSNPYKTPTSGTNLMHKFSPSTVTLPTAPLSVTTTSSSTVLASVVATTTSNATPKSQENSDKEEDILADIDELLKDKLSEGEITKEDISLDDVKDSEENDYVTTKVELKEENAVGEKPMVTEVSVSSQKEDLEKEEDKTMNIDIKKEVSSGDKSQDIVSQKTKIPEASQEASEAKSSVQGLDGVESVPCSPLATPVGSRSMTPTPTTTPPSAKSVTIEEDRDYRAWKKSIILVWNQISQHKNANLFVNAVTEADAPDYLDIVFRPMDLNSIKRNVESGHIRTTEDFERDLMLMFFNATMYNSSDHEVYNLTRDMHEDTEKILTDYKKAQLLMKESEPKSLRGKSESAEIGVASSTRPRGRSVSGSVDTPVTSRSETRKRERSGSLMVVDTEPLTRAEKKRKL